MHVRLAGKKEKSFSKEIKNQPVVNFYSIFVILLFIKYGLSDPTRKI